MNIKNAKKFATAAKIALVLNLVMFFIEFAAGLYANSMALITDSFDFLGDSLNYLIAIYVLSKAPIIRSYSAIVKALSMLVFGIVIAYNIFQKVNDEILPQSNLMIAMSFFALIVNVGVSFLLFSFKEGSSNQKSVWLCSRNDAINNLMVIIAGFFVAYFQRSWPDLVAAFIMVFLAISSSLIIFKAAFLELSKEKAPEKRF